MMKKINIKQTAFYLSILAVGILIGTLFNTSETEITEEHHSHKAHKKTLWTCSMHPQIKQPEKGKCPLCGMDLIPLDESSQDENGGVLKMSKTAMQLANIQTSLVRKIKAVKPIRVSGKIQADERKVFSQSAHIGGRIEQLLVNYTGEFVRKGQVIAYVYSPELLTAQKELLEAYKVKESQPSLFQFAKEKLKNQKVTDKQIEGILSKGKVQEVFPILSDVNGVIIKKEVDLGDHVKAGSTLYDIADLSNIWVLFDIYEKDMAWVKVGDKVEFKVLSFPDQTYTGKVTFIDPVINPKTRVAKARVEFKNEAQLLKPEMFASGTVLSALKKGKEQIVIPKSAVMWTGKRSVVYTHEKIDSGIGFKMKEVVLGTDLGQNYLVESGLIEGDEIVTNGTFSVDASAQLAGKPSMMSLEAEVKSPSQISTQIKKAIEPLFQTYFSLKNHLVKSDMEKAILEAKKLNKELLKVKAFWFSEEEQKLWTDYQSKMKVILKSLSKANDIDNVRVDFKDLSEQFIALGKIFKPFQNMVYIQFCPMANNDKGAYWLSQKEEIRNPYFGDAMLTCGNVEEEID